MLGADFLPRWSRRWGGGTPSETLLILKLLDTLLHTLLLAARWVGIRKAPRAVSRMRAARVVGHRRGSPRYSYNAGRAGLVEGRLPGDSEKCVSIVYFEGHRAKPLTGLDRRAPKGQSRLPVGLWTLEW